ncbi:PEP-CTERM sorting domain-containing protein [Pontiellaceae bacterium B12227]|nr:PEP-CTERM sorting domain-containing protein [Pontiellaceae bacterium B12227]
MKKTTYIVFGFLASLSVSALGVTIQKDVDYSTTVVVEDFSGSVDPATGKARTTLDSISGGVATYNYAAGQGPEGTITYNPLGTSFDPSLYSSMRVRMAVDRDSAGTTGVQVYPTPIPAAGNLTKTVSTGTTLRETSFDLEALSPNGSGLRVDAFNYTNDGTQDQMQIDYIMMDRGRTIGWEFDHDADSQNTTLLNLSASDVMGGSLSGTASSGDSQVWLVGNGATAPTINADIYQHVEIRMKGDAGDRIDLFWNTGARGSLTPKIDLDTAAAVDGDWHTYMLDFSEEADWTGNLTAFRLDPTATTGAEFELDYVRFMETIPEPATLGMIVAMGGGMLFVRRLMM